MMMNYWGIFQIYGDTSLKREDLILIRLLKLDFFCESLIHRLIFLLSLQQSLLSYITY